MFNAFVHINWVAVLAAAIAASVLGGIWFGIMFAKTYVRALGKENSLAPKMTPIFLVGPFLCGLVVSITSGILMQLLKIESIQGAVSLGTLVGFGYLGATAQNVAINPNIPRPFLYAAINVPYFVLSSIATCVLLQLIR